MNNSQLVELVSIELKKKKLKKSELLAYCGVNHGYLSDLVKKNNVPSIEVVLKMAEFLNCSVDYLLGRTEESKINRHYVSISGNNQTNINGDNNIKVSAVSDLESEISSILTGLQPRKRIELMMIIYKFADENS